MLIFLCFCSQRAAQAVSSSSSDSVLGVSDINIGEEGGVTSISGRKGV